MAARMLLVWLFALASGIVNACVMQPHLRHAALPAAAHQQEHAAVHGHASAGEASADSHDAPTVAQAACVKVCGETSASVPTVKPPADPWADGLVAPLPLALADVHGVPSGSVRAAMAPPRRAGASIPIAYRRLTL